MSFDISSNLSPTKTVCMKMSDLILWAEIEKYISKCRLPKYFPACWVLSNETRRWNITIFHNANIDADIDDLEKPQGICAI